MDGSVGKRHDIAGRMEVGEEGYIDMKEREQLKKHGDLGTFVVHVQHRQNSSWQGRITWMEKRQTVSFRSAWEMIRIVTGALDTVEDREGSIGGQQAEEEPPGISVGSPAVRQR